MVDLVVIGAGIVGLAQAWSAVERGLSVTVVDREPHARGASVRNFGMVWPIGLPSGPALEAALVSRQRWLDLIEQSDAWSNPRGAVFAIRHADEFEVVESFVDGAAGQGYDVDLLTVEQTARMCPLINTQGLRAGLVSRTELGVDPREVIPLLASMLERRGVAILRRAVAVGVEPGTVTLSDGRKLSGRRIAICSGEDFHTLLPEAYMGSGLQACKLHMLRMVPDAAGLRPESSATHAKDGLKDPGPMVAGGLTLRHYPSFEGCSGLAALKARVAQENPKLDEWGIHVLAAPDRHGGMVLGDSHELGDGSEPFQRSFIDDLIIEGARQLLNLDGWSVAERWTGVYAKRSGLWEYEAQPLPGVRVIHNVSGLGMTLSFGLAERRWANWALDPLTPPSSETKLPVVIPPQKPAVSASV